MGPNSSPKILRPIPKICRVCDRDQSAASFTKKAHVVPDLAGNKTLFSNYECDDCNERFGKVEDDLGKMTLFSRMFSGIPKKRGGPPAYKNPRETVSIRSSEHTINIVGREDREQEKLIVERSKGELHISIRTQAFRPLAVFKSLAKVAFMLIPSEQLTQFSHLKAWLQQIDLESGHQFGMYGHGCIMSRISGYKPTIPMVALLGRTSDIIAPACILLLIFGHFGFQIIVPCPSMEQPILLAEPFALRAFPVEYFLSPLQQPAVDYEWIDLSLPTKISSTQSWVAKGQTSF
jgi:hypothetical protein